MAQRRILAVLAHPDDETSGCGGIFSLHAAAGDHIVVVTATRGEMGALGSGGLAIRREDLPRVREEEQRAVAQLLGVREVVYLGYTDGALDRAPQEELSARIRSEMARLRPDVVLTFGPLGISRHPDHIAISRAATAAFHQYRWDHAAAGEPALLYVAIPESAVKEFGLDLDGIETRPTTVIDVTQQQATKVKALRMYRSQEDAQELAAVFEAMPRLLECFHQAHPPVFDGVVKDSLF